MTTQQQIVSKLLTQFPDAATKTLARIAIRDYPKVFMSLDSARSAMRYARGANGERARKIAADKSNFREPQVSGDPFSKLPESRKNVGYEEWGPVSFVGDLRVLVLSDIHIPFSDNKALRAALEYGRKHDANMVLLNGDIADCFQLSFWEKNPLERDFASEVKAVKEFLAAVRAGFPNAGIVYKLGNHEERFIRYMRCKAPELLGLPEFELENVFDLDSLNIQLVDNMRPIQLGKLNVLHGHEYKFSISNPVNPARGFFLRAKVHVLGGHLHQSSQHAEKNLEGKVVSAWSTGCLCDLHPAYRPLNPWNHGFAFVTVQNDGTFDVQNFKILSGKIY